MHAVLILMFVFIQLQKINKRQVFAIENTSDNLFVVFK